MPRRSVVRVYFAERGLTLSYYNDRFDLHRGDMVYVEGKLEGRSGRIVEVNYNFKIRLSDYQRVIAVADTAVKGQLFVAGSHFVTFDRAVLPREKAVTWFKAPAEDDDVICGSDDTAFCLDDLKGMGVSSEVLESGYEAYGENKVRYLCLDHGRGYAIVSGHEVYEVEFFYNGGEIRALTCSCFGGGHCKHGVAAMLQLRETLSRVEEHYAEPYERGGYFAAVDKGTLFACAIDGKDNGEFTL